MQDLVTVLQRQIRFWANMREDETDRLLPARLQLLGSFTALISDAGHKSNNSMIQNIITR